MGRIAHFLVLSLLCFGILSCKEKISEKDFVGEWIGHYVHDQSRIDTYIQNANFSDKERVAFENEMSLTKDFRSTLVLKSDTTFEMNTKHFPISGTWSYKDQNVVLDIDMYDGQNYDKLAKDPYSGFTDEPVLLNVSKENKILSYVYEFKFQRQIQFERKTQQ